MSLEVQIFQRDQITTPGVPTLVETISQGWGRQFRNAKNDYGSAAINIQLTDTDAIAACQPGRLLKFVRDGTVRGGCVLGPRKFAKVKRGRKFEQVLQVQAPGFMHVLNDARIPPHNGPGWHPWDRLRAWDWSNPYLDTTSWGAAVELWRQGDPADLSASTFIEVVRDQGRFAFGPPEGFADADAMWIWSSTYEGTGGTGGSGTLRMDPGISYFHKTFTTSDDMHVRVIAGADDFLEFALDGVKLFRTAPSPEEAWSRAQKRDLFLTAGTHTIRVKVENYTRAFSNGNIAGLVAAIHEVNPVDGSLVSVLVHTDDTWKALDYPADPPGFTASNILLLLLAEVQAAGFLKDIDPSFTATDDSASNTMPVLTDITTTVGDKFGETVRQLAGSWFDTRVNHDMTWDLWDKGTHGTASGATFERGVNITELELDGDTTPVSSLLVLHEDGYLVLGDATAGRQEFLDLSQLSVTEATARGTEELADLSSARWRAIIAVEPVRDEEGELVGGDVPFDDFDILDTATVPDPDDTPVETECVAISYTEDENGFEILVPEFGDLVLSPDEKRARDLARLSVGGLHGAAPTPAGGGPVAESPLSQGGGSFGQIAPTKPIIFHRPTDASQVTSDEYPVDAGGTVTEFAAKIEAPQAGDTDIDLLVTNALGGSATIVTLTVPAGDVYAQAAGLGYALSKDTDYLSASCADTGFSIVATARISS